MGRPFGPVPVWGEPVVCIAGGPSLTREQCEVAEIAREEGRCRIVGVNDAYRIATLDLLYACDSRWWDAHQGVSEFDGIKLTQDARARDRWSIRYIESARRDGLSSDRHLIHQGGNSGYQALNVAYLTGAPRIFLLGYDMKPAGDRAHWFGSHADRGLPDPQPCSWQAWPRAFQTIPRGLVEIVNCTPGSAITCFPSADIREVL